ncbi:hypothetical protein BZZ01_15225 [Nostocales cyanobacterium HT-58-2]|nr:hypothetical protein BZZ01_15225 [Nostocales cyanobacterium HT-58-2]
MTKLDWRGDKQITFSIKNLIECIHAVFKYSYVGGAKLPVGRNSDQQERASVNWRFQTTDAFRKMERLYPTV